MLALDLPWPAQLDVPVEGLELEAGAARADREAEPVLAGARDAHREAGVEVAVEGGHRDGGVGAFRDADGHVAVVGREAVATAVLDRAIVLDVAVGGIDLDARRLDPLQRDGAAHGFDGDVPAHVAQGDVLVHAAEVDVAFRVLQGDGALHRLEGDLTAAAAHLDLPVDGLGAHRGLGAVHVDVGVGAVEVQLHPGGRADLVVHRLRHAAPTRRLDADGRAFDRHVDMVATRVACLYAHRVLCYAVHHEPAAAVIVVEHLATADAHGRVRLLA